MSSATMWGVRAGSQSEADGLFLKKNCVALGWSEMADLSKLAANRDAYKEAFTEVYPNAKPGAVPVEAGQLFRYVHEAKQGDLVVYPSKIDRKVHIGRVVSDYRYDPKADNHYPHIRAVEWLAHAPRTRFSQGALYEISAWMTLWQIKNYADEFVAAVEGAPPVPEQDDTVGVVAEEIEENTRDFILKTLAKELKGHGFEHFVAHLLNLMGYQTRVSPVGTDAGVDIIAHRDELGFEPPIIKVQVKSGEGSVGDPVVSALYGKVDSGNEFGLLVAIGTFTNQAIGFARNKSNLRLIDGNELVDLIMAHYDDFDSKYKGLIPLKRVYVPQPVSDSDEG